MSPPTMMPDRTSMIMEFSDDFGIDTAQMTARIPPIKAPICTDMEGNPKRMARDAPTQAPEDTPSISGATSGFWRRSGTPPPKARALRQSSSRKARGQTNHKDHACRLICPCLLDGETELSTILLHGRAKYKAVPSLYSPPPSPRAVRKKERMPPHIPCPTDISLDSIERHTPLIGIISKNHRQVVFRQVVFHKSEKKVYSNQTFVTHS